MADPARLCMALIADGCPPTAAAYPLATLLTQVTNPLATLLTQVTNPLDQVPTLLPMATWPPGSGGSWDRNPGPVRSRRGCAGNGQFRREISRVHPGFSHLEFR